MNFEFLETPRLKLRKVDPVVTAYVHAQYSEGHLKDFFGLDTEAELEKQKEKFSKGLCTHNRSFLFFHVLDKSNGGYRGSCGFHTVYTDHRRAELFYLLKHEADKRKGLMSEAVAAVLEYGFSKMDLHRIEALTSTDNAASQGLLAKFGFVKEGHLRGHYLKEGVMEDSLIFSLLRQEHEAGRRRSSSV